MLAACLLVAQVSCLADPVFTVDAAAETLQAMCDAVDIVLAHLGDLIEPFDAEFIERLFNGRANTLD